MTTRIEVLDHGHVELVDSWGSDEGVIAAARMSTGKGFLGWGPIHNSECPKNPRFNAPQERCLCPHNAAGDEKLLRFLWEHKHATPFEMCGITIEVKAPIFVFREWHRHRTQSYNEMSARYIPLPDENYVPTVDRVLLSGGTNKQAMGRQGVAGAKLDPALASAFTADLSLAYSRLEELYQQYLKYGVPKELARLVLPVGRYSRMRASANLRNWFAFLTLRAAPNAQWEIQQYAFAVSTVLKGLFPRSHALWAEGMRYKD